MLSSEQKLSTGKANWRKLFSYFPSFVCLHICRTDAKSGRLLMFSAQQQTITLFQIGLGQFTDETYGRRISPSTLFTRFTISANIMQTPKLKITSSFRLSLGHLSTDPCFTATVLLLFRNLYPSSASYYNCTSVVANLFLLLQNKFSFIESEYAAISEYIYNTK